MAVVGDLDDEPAATRMALQAAKGDIDCESCAAGNNAKKRGEKRKDKGLKQCRPWETVSADDAVPTPIWRFSVLQGHG